MADTIQLGEIRYYTDEDPYHYTVDNRPLQDLEQNDITLKTAIESVTTTVNSGFQSKVMKAWVDFNPGSNVLNVNQDLSSARSTLVFFDGVFQTPDTYTVLSTSINFTSPIPDNIATIVVIWTNASLAGVTEPKPKNISTITRNSADQIISFIEGVDRYTVTYHPNGDIFQIMGGGSTQTVTYDASGNVTGVVVF